MAIFKRGNVYWYHFVWKGVHVQKSTRQGTVRVADQIEAAHKTRLAKGEVGIFEKKLAPTLREFEKRFMDSVKTRCAEKPATVRFYESKFARLLEFTPLADGRLDQIDEALIESFVQHRRKAVSPASVNRELATLRKSLRLALRWHLIDRVSMFSMLDGERERSFVLSYALEDAYFETAPRQLKDAAMLMLDTGLRVGEARVVSWPDIHLEPVGDARLGYVHVRSGKSKNAKRNVPLTARVRSMLLTRRAAAKSRYVFADADGIGPVSIYTLEGQHSRVRKALNIPECVIHSFRHTFGTRLGESGADAFTIMRIMGHSSVTVSQKYVHPTPEGMERAFKRFEAMNTKATKKLADAKKRLLPATISATVSEDQPELVDQAL